MIHLAFKSVTSPAERLCCAFVVISSCAIYLKKEKEEADNGVKSDMSMPHILGCWGFTVYS